MQNHFHYFLIDWKSEFNQEQYLKQRSVSSTTYNAPSKAKNKFCMKRCSLM